MLRLILIIAIGFTLSSTGQAVESGLRDGFKRIETNGGAAEIPTTDIDPGGTLSPAVIPEGIEPLKSDDPLLKPFLGVWRGQWEGTLDTYFIITEAQGSRVKVFNSWGRNAIVRESGMRYVWGKVYDGVMLLPSEKASESLKVQEDGTLFGLYYSRMVHMPSRIVLTRQE